MEQGLAAESVAALRSSAERLGVDPYRLARFLSDGRVADLLEALSRPALLGPRKILGLAESYLEFLEKEIEFQEGRRPKSASRRGF